MVPCWTTYLSFSSSSPPLSTSPSFWFSLNLIYDHDFMAQWLDGTMDRWCNGLMAQWYDAMAQLYDGLIVQWHE